MLHCMKAILMQHIVIGRLLVKNMVFTSAIDLASAWSDTKTNAAKQPNKLMSNSLSH